MKKFTRSGLLFVGFILMSMLGLKAANDVTIVNSALDFTGYTEGAAGSITGDNCTFVITDGKWSDPKSTPASKEGYWQAGQNFIRFAKDNGTVEITPDEKFVNGGEIEIIWGSNSNKSTIEVSCGDASQQFSTTVKETRYNSIFTIPSTVNGNSTITVKRTSVASFIFAIIVRTNISDATYYTLTTNVNPVDAGEITNTPNGSKFTENEEVTLTPTANRGYVFNAWSGVNAADIIDNKISMSGDKSVTAEFTALTERTITASTSGCEGVSVNVSETVDGKYYDGDEVVLTANGTAICNFAKWNDGNANNPRTIILNGDFTIEAIFEADVIAPLFVSGNPTSGADIKLMNNNGIQAVTLIFNENIALTMPSGITVNGTPAKNPVVSGKSISFDVEVTVGETYEIAISDAAITDIAGNAYTGSSYSFSTSLCDGAILPYVAQFDAEYSIPCWINGDLDYNQNYTGSDSSCSGSSVIRINNADGKADFHLPSCGKFSVIVSATGGRTFNLYVDGEKKATTGALSSKTCKELSYEVNTCHPVIVTIENVGTGGATISAINITDYTCHTLTINECSNGYIEIEPETPGYKYPSGTTVTLTAIAHSGYSFYRWLHDADISSFAANAEENNSVDLLIDSDKTVEAEFSVITSVENSSSAKNIVSVKYYTTLGVEVDNNTTGIIIVKTTYEDGTVDTNRKIVK